MYTYLLWHTYCSENVTRKTLGIVLITFRHYADQKRVTATTVTADRRRHHHRRYNQSCDVVIVIIILSSISAATAPSRPWAPGRGRGIFRVRPAVVVKNDGPGFSISTNPTASQLWPYILLLHGSSPPDPPPRPLTTTTSPKTIVTVPEKIIYPTPSAQNMYRVCHDDLTNAMVLVFLNNFSVFFFF